MKDNLEISDPNIISIFYHEKKSEILKLLIKEELTLKEIKDKMDINPGTIRRHLDDLLAAGLVELTRTEINRYSMLMKFYRSTAKSFQIKVEYKWP